MTALLLGGFLARSEVEFMAWVLRVKTRQAGPSLGHQPSLVKLIVHPFITPRKPTWGKVSFSPMSWCPISVHILTNKCP